MVLAVALNKRVLYKVVMDTESKPNPKGAPRVMDIQPPKRTVPHDHQIADHGTPDPESDATSQSDTQSVDADALLQQVEATHQITQSKPSAPIGLIVITVTILAIMIAVSWLALNAGSI